MTVVTELDEVPTLTIKTVLYSMNMDSMNEFGPNTFAMLIHRHHNKLVVNWNDIKQAQFKYKGQLFLHLNRAVLTLSGIFE